MASTSRVLLLAFLFAACGGGGPRTPQCIVHDQCPLGQCLNGICAGAIPCADDSVCERRSHCVESRCIPVCETDLDCPSGHTCTEKGCKEFSYKKTGSPPVDRNAAAAPLRAGVAETWLDVPVGVSLGGYAGRGGVYYEPYAEAIFPSRGFYHRLKVRALALDTGNERVVIANAPLVLIPDYLRERVVRRILDETGVNYRDHLILSVTHTHSGPARIWTLPRGFGSFGLDEHMEEIHERVAASYARAILAAVAQLAPAEMGWTLDESFDRDDKITSDRRGESPHFDDYRMFLLRVDDAQGKPLAAVVNFGIHGTFHEGPYMTDDSISGIVLKTEEALEAKEGRRVPVLFINGNGGTMSPRCDDLGHDENQKMELCGVRTVPYVLARWDTIARKESWNMRFVMKRIPVSRAHIGYADGEFYDRNPVGGLSPYLYGAFQCMLFTAAEQLPARDGDLGCVLGIENTFHAPVQVFSKAVLSALKLDDLVIVTQPAEPGMEYGAEVVQKAKTLSGIREAVIWGYSQDHHLYFLQEADWFYSGLESQTSVWGFKFGPYVARETHSMLADLAAGRTPESKVLPQDFFMEGPPAVVPDTSDPAGLGALPGPVPTQVERLSQISFTFSGGHPGAGTPMVRLQRESAGSFVDLASDGTSLAQGRTPYDNATYKFITDWRKEGAQHLWSVRWEELRDFPAGRYRFKLFLPYWDGSTAREKEAFTGAFDLVPSPGLTLHAVSLSAGSFSARVLYPAGIQSTVPRDRFQRGVDVDLDCDGQNDVTMDVTHDYLSTGIRLRDPTTGPVDPIAARRPLKFTVTRQGDAPQVLADVPAGANAAVTVPLRVGRGPVTASNSRPGLVGQAVDRVTCKAIPAPLYSVTSGFTFGGAGTYRVRVEDEWGNYGETMVTVP
jgi:hypothetical protein